jgi:hypothetical protein
LLEQFEFRFEFHVFRQGCLCACQSMTVLYAENV